MSEPIPIKYEKQIRKEISKLFNQEQYTLLPKKSYLDFEASYGLFTIQATESKKSIGSVLIKKVKTCTLGGCQNPSSYKDPNAKHEFFDLLVLMDKNNVISKLKVLNYYSDYGYEVSSKNYLKKFEGRTPCQLLEANDVDAISGATISCDALIFQLQALCE